jgi:hypothetical protein
MMDISTRIASGVVVVVVVVVNYEYRGYSRIGWCSYMWSRSARSTRTSTRNEAEGNTKL